MLLSDPKIREEFDRLSGVGWWQWDIEADELLLSSQARRILGLGPDDIVTPDSINAHRSPDDWLRQVDTIRRVLKAGGSWEVEHAALKKSGEEIWVKATGHAERRDGRTIRLFGVIQDITARRNAEKELRDSKRLLEEISSLSGIGGWEFDLATRKVRWSKETRRIYEIDDAFEPAAHHQPMFVAPAWLAAANDAIRQTIEHGVSTDLTFKAITARGNERWVRNTCRADRRDGRTVRLVGTVQDVTEQKEAEDRLAELDDRLVAAIKAAELRIWEYDPVAETVIWDPRTDSSSSPLNSTTPWNGQAILGRIVKEDRKLLSDAILAALASGTPTQLVFRTMDEGSGQRHVEVRLQRTVSPSGEPRILGVSRDVTDRVELLQTLEHRTREAETALETQGAFLARISHEIRTPMTAVIGMLEISMRQARNFSSVADLTIALRAAQDLLILLDDLIDISRIQQQKLTIDEAVFDLARLAKNVIQLFSRRAADKSLALVLEIEEGLPTAVVGDPARIRQVLINLVGNAIKFTDDGSIRLALARNPGDATIRFCVTDTGIGVHEQDTARLFERFYQVDISAARKHGGAGLGLAICRELVELMQGRIGVESTPGVGSTFWFELELPEAQGDVRSGEDEAGHFESEPLRILVAEDNLSTQRILKIVLGGADHRITVAPDGASAVHAARTSDFDLIIMDSMMPEMDGVTAAQEIRKLVGRRANVPILALTANATPGERERCLAAGMNEYLTKPIDVGQLLALVGRLGKTAAGG